MKKSDLRKVIKGVIKEQMGTATLNTVAPVLNKVGGTDHWNVHCPTGYEPIDPSYSQVVNLSDYNTTVQTSQPAIQQAIMVSGCVKMKLDKPGKIPPSGMTSDEDPLGPGNVTSGGFGTQEVPNLGGLPSN